MASEFLAEVRKIPPVTRFLCASSLAVTIPVLLEILPAFYVVFVKELVIKRFQIWRLYTSFFLGSRGIGYIFDVVMLYRNSDQLESTRYARRSADYAWQLFIAAGAILALNIPLSTYVHNRAFTLALTYIAASLSPPGSQSSLFGLVTFPVVYLPYVMLGLDVLQAGPAVLPTGISGLVVGHLWWYGVWGGVVGTEVPVGVLARYGVAPAWVRRLFGEHDGAGGRGTVPYGQGSTRLGGVHVIPPRRLVGTRNDPAASTSTASGHNWGTGRRLGD